MDQESIDNIVLSFFFKKGLGIKSVLKIVEEYGGIDNFISEIKNTSNSALLSRFYFSDLESKLRILREKKVKYISIFNSKYPKSLKSINDPPLIIFYKGEWQKDLIEKSFTIVGSRVPSKYGLENARKFAFDLSSKGVSVVSGMAIGIDKEAHLGSLDANGYTIAVLAGSPESPSPLCNTDVYNKILNNGGAVISEYPPFTKVKPGLFPRRNRIVASISLGTLVVEAGEKSGALITANLAFDYGKQVFAIPGNIFSPKSKGCNYLIKNNKAKLVENYIDILEEYGYSFPKNSNIYKEKELSLLNEKEKFVYNAIIPEPIFLEDISKNLNLNISEVSSIVSMLEIKNFVRKETSGKLVII